MNQNNYNGMPPNNMNNGMQPNNMNNGMPPNNMNNGMYNQPYNNGMPPMNNNMMYNNQPNNMNNEGGPVIYVEPRKKSKFPLYLLILILIAAAAFGGYYYGTHYGKQSEKNTQNNNQGGNSTEQNKEINENEGNSGGSSSSDASQTSTKPVVERGTDANTSGKETKDVKTTTITLNGNPYQLTIEILLYDKVEQDGLLAETYSQNVYLNGYKILDNEKIPYPSLVLSNSNNGYYNTAAEFEINDAKTIKDTATAEEYLVFSDCTNGYGGNFYIVKADGTLIKKMVRKANESGLSIYTNTPTNKANFTNNPSYSNGAAAGTPSAYEYLLKAAWPNEVFDNGILHVEGWTINGKKETFEAAEGYVPCDLSLEGTSYELYIDKLTITNGVVNENKVLTITNSDANYLVEAAGACR